MILNSHLHFPKIVLAIAPSASKMFIVINLVSAIPMVYQTFNRLMLSLVLLTLLALYAHDHWMTHTVQIDGRSQFAISAVDDRPEGGKSYSQLHRSPQKLRLDCDIKVAYQWPFCELAIRLSRDDKGLDLSRFDRLTLKIKASGPEQKQSIRLFLRNFNSAYSKPGQDATLKPHEIVFDPNETKGEVSFKLPQFMVASWWVQEHPTTIEHVGPELDQVVAVSIATGGNVQAGAHVIELEKMELSGVLIPADRFRLIIIFVWITAILIYLIWAWQRSQIELRESARLRKELKHSNELLEQRVNERTRALAASNAQLIETLENLEGTRHELVQIEKNSALGALVSGIAHELNTPIGNAVLVSSTLSDKLRDFEASTEQNFTRKILKEYFIDAKRGIDILQQNLARSATLITSFKQLAADQHSEQRRKFRLHDMMEETMLAMMPVISKTGHQLQLDIDHKIMMDAYPGPLSQIMINFINNALLHGFEGKAQGTMSITAQLSGQEHVEICFSDDGVGIPASIIQRVFEPFFTTKLGKGGSGLGMHLVHSMVTQMFGGKIELHSIPNEGTRIILQLPLVAPDNTRHVLKIGAPADVVKDFHLFLAQRPIMDIHDFAHPHSRRDVVELTVFLQALLRLEPKVEYELTTVDSYAIGIEQLRAGKLAALATTVWKSDIALYPREIQFSSPIIDNGKSVVGVFTTKEKRLSLDFHQLSDLQHLRFVSNRDWSADWKAIQELGVKHCADVKTWRQMVYMVCSGECDALLAPFNQHPEAEIELDDCRLVPLPGIKVRLNDSRHFAASKAPHAAIIISNVFPQLKDLVDNGQIEKAMYECGFYLP